MKNVFDHTLSWSFEKFRSPRGDARFILQTTFIPPVYFVLAETTGLRIKLAKQINHMMRSLLIAAFISTPPPPPSSSFFYWHIFPSFPPFLLKLQLSRHEGPCGPDQMFQAAHFPTLCLMEYSWATRHRSSAHSTAPRCTDQRPLIYLFISSPCCQAV